VRWEGWGVEQHKLGGGWKINFLIYSPPAAGDSPALREDPARAVAPDCPRHDIPLFLEPMAYPLDPSVRPDSAEFGQHRPAVVIETARRLSALAPAVLKIQFPIDARSQPDPRAWDQTRAPLDEACAVP